MATKSVYQELDPLAASHFKIDSAPIFGVLSTKCDAINNVYNVGINTYFSIKNLLYQNTTTIQNNKKAFVLPLCTVSLDRIKAACKQHDISLTNDYEEADIIITHDNFAQDKSADKIQSSLMMFEIRNFICINNTQNEIIDNSKYPVIDDGKFRTKFGWRGYYNSNRKHYTEGYFVTGMAVNIAYNANNYDIIDVNDLLNTHNKITLTEELYHDLVNYITSSDKDNLSIVAKIIPTIDYDQNQHLIWRMAKSIGYAMYKFNKDKDVQHWLNESNFNDYKYMSASALIEQLESKNQLSKETFTYLEPICRREIKIENRELYIFKVQLKPEYQKYYE